MIVKSNWYSDGCKQLVVNISNNSHIRKAVFVYDTNKNFIAKYPGVTDAQKALNISHSTIHRVSFCHVERECVVHN